MDPRTSDCSVVPGNQRSKTPHTTRHNDGEPSTGLIHLWTAAIQSGHRAVFKGGDTNSDDGDSVQETMTMLYYDEG